jgi:hypothetical protein
MGKALAAVSPALVVAVVAIVAKTAHAQPQQTRSARDYKTQPLNLRKEQIGTEAYAASARARVKAGDCAGALTSFDAALRTSNQDPTLYRDRGLCHEQLGHPYPAIDDYRAYLTDMPTAPDAPTIRDRLTRLEDETLGREPSTDANDDTNVPPVSGGASVSVSTEGGSAAASASATSHDKLAYYPDEDPLNTPLRRAKGFTLAPFFAEHKFFFSGSSFGDAETWSESVGAQLRYSFGPVAALAVEVGYEHFNSSTSADPFILAGLTSLLELELRFPLDRDYENQFLLGPGFGYEHIAFTPTDPDFPSIATNAIVPRLRFGYRHLFEASAALDFSIDVGAAKWFVSGDVGGIAGASFDIPTSAMLAANVALVWGL